jgi:hypothetical protein
MQNQTTFNPEDMYHMFDLKPLNNDIWYFKNVLSYPDELVSFINEVDADERSYLKITKWSEWTASNNKDVKYGKNKNIISNKIKDIIDNGPLDKKILYIRNSLEMAAEMSLDKYLLARGLDKSQYRLSMDLIPIREWQEGSYMGPHCDSYDGNKDIAFSIVMYLNESYTGGEIGFPNHDILLKPKAGSLIIFPSQEPYVHQVHTLESGLRYTCHLSVYKN